MGFGCYKITASFSLFFTICGAAACIVGLTTNYWWKIDFFGRFNEGLIWACIWGRCGVKSKLLNFKYDRDNDVVLILLIGSIAFSLLTVILNIVVLAKKKKSICVVSFLNLNIFLSVGCGIACCVYANIQTRYKFTKEITNVWSNLVTCIGVGLLIFSWLFCLSLFCIKHHYYPSLSFHGPHELHENVGTLDSQITAPPYNPTAIASTTPSYNGFQQQMDYHAHNTQFNYPAAQPSNQYQY